LWIGKKLSEGIDTFDVGEAVKKLGKELRNDDHHIKVDRAVNFIS